MLDGPRPAGPPSDGAAPETYSGRCRTVADAVLHCYTLLDDSVDPQASSDGWAWLEGQLTLAATTPGTVAELLLRVAPPPPSHEPLPTILRAVAWLRLGAPSDGGWARGPESPHAWSLLMAPAPADQHEEWWLAASHRLSPSQLAGLTLGRNQLPSHARIRQRRGRGVVPSGARNLDRGE
jgi:hypothetical protein